MHIHYQYRGSMHIKQELGTWKKNTIVKTVEDFEVKMNNVSVTIIYILH